MNPLVILGKVATFVPRVVAIVKEWRKGTQLSAPLGESEAAKALRLEAERRALAEADKHRRG